MITLMKKLFGTDGMRGEAGQFPLDAATVRTAGRSLAARLAERLGRAPRIVVGRDTRESGEWIERALLEGAREAGARVESAGVITTPGVAYLARTLPADAGVVVSASHNPFQDNGVKIFDPAGRKLDDATERLVEADIHAEREGGAPPGVLSESKEVDGSVNEVDGGAAGEGARRSAELRARYLDYLAGEVAAGFDLDGLSVVVDCANGAAYELAPALLARLGARVTAMGDAPDGRNINRDCGSLHTEALQRRVIAEGAQAGVAYDGDADRSLFVDARGQLVDGDATLWVLAKRMRERGRLTGDRVVATVMSNLGLELALRSLGVKLLRTDVGDKYVLEELLRTGAALGGEQSGHIIFPRTSLAGDGLITTVKLLRAMRESGRPLHELTQGFTRLPQVLTNVRVREKLPFEEVKEIESCARDVRAQLGERGRLLLRYSGTEPLARVMIEGQRQNEIERLAEGLADVIRRNLGAG
jgi:phosphoglucosamine mutase